MHEEYKTLSNEKRHILIVLDDVVSDLNKIDKDPFLISLFYNRRQLVHNACISIIVTT